MTPARRCRLRSPAGGSRALAPDTAPLTLPSPRRGEGFLRDASGGEAAALPFVAPGFVDIQINGYGGQEFSSAALRPEGVAKIVRHALFLRRNSRLPHAHDRELRRDAARRGGDSRGLRNVARRGPGRSGDSSGRSIFLARMGRARAHPAEHCRRPTGRSSRHCRKWPVAAFGCSPCRPSSTPRRNSSRGLRLPASSWRSVTPARRVRRFAPRSMPEHA